jgi:succinyl-diaminopimelate desuccinylase
MNQYIGQDEIVALLQKLVQHPTVNPPADTTECATFILERLNENGIPAQLREGKMGVANVVARLSGRKRGKVLLLNGHIDVVAPGNDRWKDFLRSRQTEED